MVFLAELQTEDSSQPGSWRIPSQLGVGLTARHNQSWILCKPTQTSSHKFSVTVVETRVPPASQVVFPLVILQSMKLSH